MEIQCLLQVSRSIEADRSLSEEIPLNPSLSMVKESNRASIRYMWLVCDLFKGGKTCKQSIYSSIPHECNKSVTTEWDVIVVSEVSR